jgi:hypothetical protein
MLAALRSWIPTRTLFVTVDTIWQSVLPKYVNGETWRSKIGPGQETVAQRETPAQREDGTGEEERLLPKQDIAGAGQNGHCQLPKPEQLLDSFQIGTTIQHIWEKSPFAPFLWLSEYFKEYQEVFQVTHQLLTRSGICCIMNLDKISWIWVDIRQSLGISGARYD